MTTTSAAGYRRITVSDGEQTPFGRVILAGEVRNAEPLMPRTLRVHEGVVISVVTGGRGRYLTTQREELPITDSTITVVLPGEAHWYGTDPGEPWDEWFAVVEGPVFELLMSAGRLTWSGPRPLPRAARATDLALLLRAAPPPSGAEQQIWALARWLSAALLPEADHESERWDWIAARLTGDLAEPLTMQQVAAEAGLDYERFRRQFRQRFGRPPLAYRNDRRLETAATLLKVTNLTCQEIARRLGFCDEFHLSRRFRSRYGVSPTGYRS